MDMMIQDFKSRLDIEEEQEANKIRDGAQTTTIQDPDHNDLMVNKIFKKGKQIQTKVINQPVAKSNNLKDKIVPSIAKKRNSAHLLGDTV